MHTLFCLGLRLRIEFLLIIIGVSHGLLPEMIRVSVISQLNIPWVSRTPYCFEIPYSAYIFLHRFCSGLGFAIEDVLFLFDFFFLFVTECFDTVGENSKIFALAIPATLNNSHHPHSGGMKFNPYS